MPTSPPSSNPTPPKITSPSLSRSTTFNINFDDLATGRPKRISRLSRLSSGLRISAHMANGAGSMQADTKDQGIKTSIAPATVERTTKNGIRLEPQPSDDPLDPLNWKLSTKVITLGIISLCGFAGGCIALANQYGIVVQAEIYHKTPTQLSYGGSAATAGTATGPLLWVPLSRYYGKTSVLFWTLIAAFACMCWSAGMTGEDDYISFILSRWLGATFGSAAQTIPGGVVTDTFFLHQRGRAYAVFAASIIGGAAVAGTASGFIVGTAPWTVQFWWIVALLGVAIIAVFLFLDDTTYDRRVPATSSLGEHRSFFHNRWATLCPGTKVVAPSATNHGPFDCILIGVQPVTILAGLFFSLTFGWAVSVNILLGVYLQTPVEAGGYGFIPVNNACFSFLTWGAVLCSAGYGVAFNDRLPLWMCRRSGGVWKPEHRLYPVLFPPLIMVPLALGLFGATLQYHLNWGVLAFAFFLINMSEGILLPPVVNYITECFVTHSTEVFVILNFYRFILGSTVPFFIDAWTHEVGIGWVFGSMAFFCLIGFAFTWVLAIYGPQLRLLSMARYTKESEDGDRIFYTRSSEDQTAIVTAPEQAVDTK